MLWIILNPARIYANTNPIWILPIIVYPADVNKILSEFGRGNTNVKMGFSIGFEYLGTEYLGNQFTYPEQDHKTNLAHLESMSAKSIETNMPFLVHFPGHRFSVADYIATNKESMMYTYEGKAITELPEWNDPNQPMGAIPTYRIGSYMYSLNEYNTTYRNYKKRNLQAATTYLANFAKLHPTLFAGVSLDSEISFCPASFPGWKNYSYSFDYNPLTIVQWRHWLSGNTGSYTNNAYLNPYANGAKYQNKGKNWTLNELKSRYNTNYTSWDYVIPPNITLDDTGKIKIISGTQVQVDDWSQFKASLTNNMLRDMANWIVETGIPQSQIYTHQLPILYELPELNGYCGVPYESAQVDGIGYGTTLYGSMTASRDMFQRISNLNSNWGVFEWNPTDLSKSENQSAIYVSNALQLAYDFGADIISPNYFVSSSPIFPGDPLELNGNVGYIQGLKSFLNKNSTSQMPGDLNGDGKVNVYDFVKLLNGFNTIYTPDDFSILLANYGK